MDREGRGVPRPHTGEIIAAQIPAVKLISSRTVMHYTGRSQVSRGDQVGQGQTGEAYSMKDLRRMGGLTWEEAEVVALNRQEWHRSVTQYVHVDVG